MLIREFDTYPTHLRSIESLDRDPEWRHCILDENGIEDYRKGWDGMRVVQVGYRQQVRGILSMSIKYTIRIYVFISRTI